MKILLFVIALLMLFPLPSYAQRSSDTAVTKIGSPKGGDSGWPTAGRVTQGSRGPGGHLAHGLIALDIANSPGTQIYATFDGTAYAYSCSSDGACNESYGRLGNFVKLVPDANPSAFVLYGHMMAVTIANEAKVKKGDQLGLMGHTGFVIPNDARGTHLHYEFRGLPMAPPYIPQAIIPETCGICEPGETCTACSPAQIP